MTKKQRYGLMLLILGAALLAKPTESVWGNVVMILFLAGGSFLLNADM